MDHPHRTQQHSSNPPAGHPALQQDSRVYGDTSSPQGPAQIFPIAAVVDALKGPEPLESSIGPLRGLSVRDVALLDRPVLLHLAAALSHKAQIEPDMRLIPIVQNLIQKHAPGQITPFHHIVPKIALLCQNPNLALPLIHTQLCVKQNPFLKISIQDYLLYTYYSALVLFRTCDYKKAYRFVMACISAPAINASKIQIEAYKLFAFLNLMTHKNEALPEYTSLAVVKSIKKECAAYDELQAAFRQAPSAFQNALEKHKIVLLKDNFYYYRVACVRESWIYAIQRMGKVFCRSSLDKCCIHLGCTKDQHPDIINVVNTMQNVHLDQTTFIISFYTSKITRDHIHVQTLEALNQKLGSMVRDLTVIKPEMNKMLDMNKKMIAMDMGMSMGGKLQSLDSLYC